MLTPAWILARLLTTWSGCDERILSPKSGINAPFRWDSCNYEINFLLLALILVSINMYVCTASIYNLWDKRSTSSSHTRKHKNIWQYMYVYYIVYIHELLLFVIVERLVGLHGLNTSEVVWIACCYMWCVQICSRPSLFRCWSLVCLIGFLVFKWRLR